MKNNLKNLFKNYPTIQNEGTKYSVLLEQFMTPFVDELVELKNYEDIFDLAINAWNIGNVNLILPKEKREEAIDSIRDKDTNLDLLKRMIKYKISHFKEYTNFIVDYDYEERNDEPVLSVFTQEEDTFINGVLDVIEENKPDGYEENFINRTAIIIKPLQPFLDWGSNLYPDDIEEMKETKTYLISEDIEDVEAWLKNKFDKIFMFELEGWHTNKKEWPQRRNYKMFKEWFQVDISTLVFDFERKPVYKS